MLALTLAVALACELDQRSVDVTEGELSERGETTPNGAPSEGRATSGSREPGSAQSAIAQGSSGSGGEGAQTSVPVTPAINGDVSAMGVAGSSALGSAGAASTTATPPVASGGASGSDADTMMGAGGTPSATEPPATAPPATAPPATEPPAMVPQPVPPAPQPPAPSVPSSNCPGPQFLCDDFEGVASGAAPNPALWQLIAGFAPATQSADVQVSNQQARTGDRSLRVLGSSARNGVVATLPQSRYFVRAWLLVDATPVGPVFIGAGTGQNSETRLRIAGQSFATLNTVGPGDAVRPAAATAGSCADCVTLRANEWFCAELFIDNPAQEATLWIDNQEAASIVSGQGGWPEQPAQPALFLGSMGLQGGQAGVFIDDVAAGPVRLGCD